MQKSLEPGQSDSKAHATAQVTQALAFPVLLALSVAHLLNDMMQSLVPAIYPIIKEPFGLDFGQIGLITFTFQVSACLFQPIVGHLNDVKPRPYSMAAGMAFTLLGLVMLGLAQNFAMLLLGAGLVGTGSSIFHPEATRVARLSSGGQLGLAQSLFQFGGRLGGSLGPLLAAFIVVPRGQGSLVWFSVTALSAMLILIWVGSWSIAQRAAAAGQTSHAVSARSDLSSRTIWISVALLIVLMVSKDAYNASISSFYTFYLIDRFKIPVETSQLLLFLFLVATTLGALIGGPIGDRIGRRRIILVSILGALPFSLIVPYANLFWTVVLTILVGAIMASAFAAILIYAMELLPGRVGLIAGIFYGLTFGLGGISAAVLGELADRTSIATVFQIASFLPLLGVVAWLLPDIGGRMRAAPH
jgi:FSR family fosmidomycin resistance protein-like MFS transporter